jgi:hypothetical protein
MLCRRSDSWFRPACLGVRSLVLVNRIVVLQWRILRGRRRSATRHACRSFLQARLIGENRNLTRRYPFKSNTKSVPLPVGHEDPHISWQSFDLNLGFREVGINVEGMRRLRREDRANRCVHVRYRSQLPFHEPLLTELAGRGDLQ